METHKHAGCTGRPPYVVQYTFPATDPETDVSIFPRHHCGPGNLVREFSQLQTTSANPSCHRASRCSWTSRELAAGHSELTRAAGGGQVEAVTPGRASGCSKQAQERRHRRESEVLAALATGQMLCEQALTNPRGSTLSLSSVGSENTIYTSPPSKWDRAPVSVSHTVCPNAVYCVRHTRR